MSTPGFALDNFVDQIIRYREQQQLAKYLATVSLALLVYDWIISIGQEVKFIWRHSWSWGRVIYHANRVWSLTLLGTTLTVLLFLQQPSISTCKRVGYMYAYGAPCQYAIISSMFLLRCWALFDKKRVVWVLSGGLVLVTIGGITLAISIVNRANFMDNPLPNIFSGCVMIVPDYLWATYIMPAVYEITLLSLTIARIRILTKDVGTTLLLQTLAQNGVSYFVTLVILVMLGCIGGTIQHVKIATNGSGLFTAVPSIVCSRMIFSLYEISDNVTQEGQTDCDTSNGIIPQFAIPLQSLAGIQYTSRP